MINPWMKANHRSSLYSAAILTIPPLVSSISPIFKMYFYQINFPQMHIQVYQCIIKLAHYHFCIKRGNPSKELRAGPRKEAHNCTQLLLLFSFTSSGILSFTCGRMINFKKLTHKEVLSMELRSNMEQRFLKS